MATMPKATPRNRIRLTPNERGSDLRLYGIVGDEFDGFTADDVRDHLDDARGEVTVHLNSAGGIVHEGMAIHSALREHGNVRVVVDGLAASIASVIALAGPTAIHRGAMMMIHNPWNLALGDAETMRRNAERLDQVRESLITIYHARTGIPRNALITMMDRETWLTAEEAVDQGFANELIDSEPEFAAAAMARCDLSILTKIPERVAVAIAPHLEGNPMPPKASTEPKDKPDAADKTTAPSAAERNRATEIRDAVSLARLDESFAETLIEEGIDIDTARARIFDKLADAAEPVNDAGQRVEIRSQSAAVTVTRDAPTVRDGMTEALAARAQGRRPTEVAAEYARMRIADMARAILEDRGQTTRLWSDSTAIDRALHTTSDFPELLTGVGERVLLDAYQAAPAGIRRVSAERTARDFRAQQRLRISEAPELKKVVEGGEFTHGTMQEAKESYALETFGRIFSISRQALVNDDLDAFGDLAQRLGVAAAEFEASKIVELLTANPTMQETSKALFHTDHGNLAGDAAAPGVDSVGAARLAMRRQKGIGSEKPINIEPRILLVPAALETDAEKLLAQITAATADTVNPFAGRLELAVDPRLDDDSATRWYVFADPSAAPVLEHAYLQEEEGPRVTMREGFEVDGLEMRVRLDFGAGAVDYRGAFRNDGNNG